MADHGGDGSRGEVIDCQEDCGETMVAETEDQTREETVAGSGAVAASGGDGSGDQQQEVSGGDERHATEAEPRAKRRRGQWSPALSQWARVHWQRACP
ncbi:hypothetical protein RHMOL_Rhmol05G0160400 [Rhododendron molle]|uniref:Uncharacterized protein n=1 Tax=Rhododendron molle TaxID=49168 RepID=A0ACC0NQM1_RHOML|nr:hypothetical protein RHMOL_Rhmol05G0160400 [Rhododendron molle]